MRSKPKKTIDKIRITKRTGPSLLRRAWKQINKPEMWDQFRFSSRHQTCKSARCIGGWIMEFANVRCLHFDEVVTIGRLLGTTTGITWFTGPSRTMPELYAFSVDYMGGKRSFSDKDIRRYMRYRGPVRKTI